MGAREPLSVRVYRWLLLAYPRAFRRRFGREMIQVLTLARRQAASGGRRASARLWGRLLADLAASAARERGHALAATRPAPRLAPALALVALIGALGPAGWRRPLVAADDRAAAEPEAAVPPGASAAVATPAPGSGLPKRHARRAAPARQPRPEPPPVASPAPASPAAAPITPAFVATLVGLTAGAGHPSSAPATPAAAPLRSRAEPPALIRAQPWLALLDDEVGAATGGDVRLILHIDNAGHVSQAWIQRSGGRRLDRIAKQLAQEIEFRPARDARGQPQASVARFAIHFGRPLRPLVAQSFASGLHAGPVPLVFGPQDF